MMEEGMADLLELARLPDVLVCCSSTGWTDEKHMIYLRLLEESFISHLHAGECNYKGLFNCSSRSIMRIESSKQIVKYESADQGGLEIAEGSQAKSCIKTERVDSPSCSGSQKDQHVRSMDNNASTSDLLEEATPQIRATCSVQSSKCYSGKRKHSPSRSADFYKRTRAFSQEGSDQNFDEETKGIGESRGLNKKRLKSADDKINDQEGESVVPCTKAKLHQASVPNVCEKHGDKCDGSPKMHADLLDAEAGSPSCRDHGST